MLRIWLNGGENKEATKDWDPAVQLFSCRLKNSWKVGSNRDAIRQELLKTCDVFVLAGPRMKLEESEIQALTEFVSGKISAWKSFPWEFSPSKVHDAPFLFRLYQSMTTDFLSEGGRLLVMLGDGGEKRFQTNVNLLLEVRNLTLSFPAASIGASPSVDTIVKSQSFPRNME